MCLEVQQMRTWTLAIWNRTGSDVVVQDLGHKKKLHQFIHWKPYSFLLKPVQKR